MSIFATEKKARKKKNAGMMSYFYASGKSSVATPLQVKKTSGALHSMPMTPQNLVSQQ